MQLIDVNLDLLGTCEWNANVVSPENERKIERSITEMGVVKPLIVREVRGALAGNPTAQYEILGGNHRFEALKRLGYSSTQVINLGDIDDIKAKRVALIDNARYGSDDAVRLADILEEIGTPGEIEQILPYTDAQLEALFASTEVDLDELDMDDEDDPDLGSDDNSSLSSAPTHMTFQMRVPVQDAGKVSSVLASIVKTQGFTTGSEKENAGDALVWLINQYTGQSA